MIRRDRFEQLAPELSTQGFKVLLDIVVTAGDGNLSASQTFSIQVNPTNQPPVLLPLYPQSGREGTPLQFTLTGTDIDGDTLSYSALSALPTGAAFDPKSGNFQWTPAYGQAGTYLLRFGVLDPAGLTDSTTVEVDIAPVNQSSIEDVSAMRNSFRECTR